MAVRRNRFLYFLIGCLVAPLGLASRRYGAFLPEFVAIYAGDTLWAVMAFLSIGLMFPRWSTMRVSVAALLLSYADEVSQLYHAPWIDAVRATWLGGLILGFGFLWSDMVCYTVGVFLATAVEVVFGNILLKTTKSLELPLVGSRVLNADESSNPKSELGRRTGPIQEDK